MKSRSFLNSGKSEWIAATHCFSKVLTSGQVICGKGEMKMKAVRRQGPLTRVTVLRLKSICQSLSRQVESDCDAINGRADFIEG
jgi:hypothetical protein